MSTKTPTEEERTDAQPMALDADEKTQKRAKWGSFAFVLPTAGRVNVANFSYGSENVADHTYTVTVDESGPTSCTCPADTYHEGACKHRVAVARTEPVLMAALRSIAEDRDDDGSHDDEPELVTDGGVVEHEHEADTDADDRITGPHTGYDRLGNAEHSYYRCEACGDEAIRRRDLVDGHDCGGGR